MDEFKMLRGRTLDPSRALGNTATPLVIIQFLVGFSQAPVHTFQVFCREELFTWPDALPRSTW